LWLRWRISEALSKALLRKEWGTIYTFFQVNYVVLYSHRELWKCKKGDLNTVFLLQESSKCSPADDHGWE
jgi:hypothetical protein